MQEGVGLAAEGWREIADALVDPVPCQEGVVEAGAVCLAVGGDRLALVEQRPGRVAPRGVGGEAVELGALAAGRAFELEEIVEAGLEAGDVVLDGGEGFGLLSGLVENGVERLQFGGGDGAGGGVLQQRASALEEIVVAVDVAGMDVGGVGEVEVLLPVLAEKRDAVAGLNVSVVVVEEGVEGRAGRSG